MRIASMSKSLASLLSDACEIILLLVLALSLMLNMLFPRGMFHAGCHLTVSRTLGSSHRGLIFNHARVAFAWVCLSLGTSLVLHDVDRFDLTSLSKFLAHLSEIFFLIVGKVQRYHAMCPSCPQCQGAQIMFAVLSLRGDVWGSPLLMSSLRLIDLRSFR